MSATKTIADLREELKRVSDARSAEKKRILDEFTRRQDYTMPAGVMEIRFAAIEECRRIVLGLPEERTNTNV